MPYRDALLEPEHPILVVAMNGAVHGLDRATGKVVWNHMLGGAGAVLVTIALRHGVLLAGTEKMTVFRIDYLSGKTLWERRLAFGRPTFLVERDCIIIAKGETITCLDHDGHDRWSRFIGSHGDVPNLAALAVPGNVAPADG